MHQQTRRNKQHVLWIVCTYTKSAKLAWCKFFWPWPGSSVSKYSASCSGILFTKSTEMEIFLQHQKHFSPCISSSPQLLLLFLPTLPPLTLRSQSFPHFWSIFYALLHYSQLPFTVHYLFPSFTNALCTFLSFLHFPLPSLALLLCIMTLSSTSWPPIIIFLFSSPITSSYVCFFSPNLYSQSRLCTSPCVSARFSFSIWNV